MRIQSDVSGNYFGGRGGLIRIFSEGNVCAAVGAPADAKVSCAVVAGSAAIEGDAECADLRTTEPAAGAAG